VQPHIPRVWPIQRTALVITLLAASVGLPASPARALTGSDGLIAIATSNGIEVFDSSGDGSDLHVLIPNGPELIVQDPAWSPRGNLIAYTHWDAHVTLWVVRADGSGAHQISATGEDASEAAWSPDGRIAYLREGSTVVIMDDDGKHRTVVDPRELLGRSDVGIAGRPAWTADGRLVLLLAGLNLPESPFIADGDGTNLHALTYADGTTPDSSDLSSNWQFSSTGLVTFVAFDPQDNYRWVHFSTFDGTYIVEASPDVTTDLGSFQDVALSPSGQRAVLTRPPQVGIGADETAIGVTDVDLTQADPFTGGFGFSVPGQVAGLDWQPRCSIIGTSGDDALTGTPGPDLICGLGGNDTIQGLGGNDVIYGGPGDDVISGGRGNDVVVGDRGTDTLEGNLGRDLINARHDAYAPDTVDGGMGHDVCIHDKADILTSC